MLQGKAVHGGWSVGESVLAPDKVAAMVLLHESGWGTKPIAGALRCSRNTVSRYLAAGGSAAMRPPRACEERAGVRGHSWRSDRSIWRTYRSRRKSA